MDQKPVLLKQTRIKLGKYPYKKNKDCIINFEIPPADHLTKEFILNSVEAEDQLLQEFQTNTSRSWVDNEDKVLESSPLIFKLRDVL